MEKNVGRETVGNREKRQRVQEGGEKVRAPKGGLRKKSSDVGEVLKKRGQRAARAGAASEEGPSEWWEIREGETRGDCIERRWAGILAGKAVPGGVNLDNTYGELALRFAKVEVRAGAVDQEAAEFWGLCQSYLKATRQLGQGVLVAGLMARMREEFGIVAEGFGHRWFMRTYPNAVPKGDGAKERVQSPVTGSVITTEGPMDAFGMLRAALRGFRSDAVSGRLTPAPMAHWKLHFKTVWERVQFMDLDVEAAKYRFNVRWVFARMAGRDREATEDFVQALVRDIDQAEEAYRCAVVAGGEQPYDLHGWWWPKALETRDEVLERRATMLNAGHSMPPAEYRERHLDREVSSTAPPVAAEPRWEKVITRLRLGLLNLQVEMNRQGLPDERLTHWKEQLSKLMPEVAGLSLIGANAEFRRVALSLAGDVMGWRAAPDRATQLKWGERVIEVDCKYSEALGEKSGGAPPAVEPQEDFSRVALQDKFLREYRNKPVDKISREEQMYADSLHFNWLMRSKAPDAVLDSARKEMVEAFGCEPNSFIHRVFMRDFFEKLLNSAHPSQLRIWSDSTLCEHLRSAGGPSDAVVGEALARILEMLGSK